MIRLAPLFAALVALLALTGRIAADPAVQVTIPLTIDYLTLGAALKQQLYTAPGGRALVWRGASDCEFLYSDNPRFAQHDPDTVTLESDGQLGLGVRLGDKCVNPISWQG
ncbi:MAG: hypothetical protein ACRD3S_18715, partial [Terracidiphilus sp.]